VYIVPHPRKKSEKAQGLPAIGASTSKITPSATPPTDANGNAHTGGAPYSVLHTPATPIYSTNGSRSGCGSPDGNAHVGAEAFTRASTVHVETE